MSSEKIYIVKDSGYFMCGDTMETTMESSTIAVRINDLKECAERLRSKK